MQDEGMTNEEVQDYEGPEVSATEEGQNIDPETPEAGSEPTASDRDTPPVGAAQEAAAQQEEELRAAQAVAEPGTAEPDKEFEPQTIEVEIGVGGRGATALSNVNPTRIIDAHVDPATAEGATLRVDGDSATGTLFYVEGGVVGSRVTVHYGLIGP